MAKKFIEYELKAPGIGFSVTKFGTLMFRCTPKNILMLRDQLQRAVDSLSHTAVNLIEQERSNELKALEPPLTPEQLHVRRIEAAKVRPMSVRTPMRAGRIAQNIIEDERPVTEAPPEENPNVRVTGGFEPDDGSLGEPPASIRR